MKYRSTRGGVSGCSFEEALFSGYSSDGGLFVPEIIPAVNQDTMQAWSKLSYKQLVAQIVNLYVSQGEIPECIINDLLNKAFSGFDCDEVVKFAELQGGLVVAELFHGPTLAFKDLALSCVGQFYNYFLNKSNRHMIILVGTSGDTGSAAIEAVHTLSSVDIVVLLPKNRCTEVQEKQMTTVISDNVHIYRVEGTSDDLDFPIKRCFADTSFTKKHNLCSINSINWARIMVQIAHYYYCYFQVCPTCDEEVEIVVPTGACGNVTAGLFAKMMGLPVRFTCAVNTNDIVARTIESGDFSASDHVDATFASAMDIQIPYNVERMLYLLSEQNTSLIKQLMKEFEMELKLTIPQNLQNKMRTTFNSFRGDNELILETMKRCWIENQYILCPHTSLGVAYHYSQTQRDTVMKKRVCIATASPAKFEEAVAAADIHMKRTPVIEALLQKPTKFSEMLKGEDWDAMLRKTIEDITQNNTRV